MAEQAPLLRAEERVVLERLAEQGDIEGQRARALLALDDGRSQTEAAEATDLSANQVRYALKKFEEQRLLAFPDALALLPADPPTERPAAPVAAKAAITRSQLDRLLVQVDGLIRDLRATLPESGDDDYSPARMLALVRDSAARYAPEVQVRMLKPFEDLSQEDLLDMDTWKGIAYMIGYSTQFQAGKTRDQLNATLPQPIKPATVTRTVRDGLDRYAPQLVKDLAANLEGATAEDLLDPDTWKGLAYLVGYSAQFQAGKARDTLNEELPQPLKPDTVVGLVQSTFDRYAPDVAKQIVATFEEATLEDLLDPDTWKGVWYLLNYSLQFQAGQLTERVSGKTAEAPAAD